MSGPFSPTSPTPLAFYDPESWSWRTSQGCLLSEAPESLERLPHWGTTSDGALYELQIPERLTAARDGSALLGTPRAFLAHWADRGLKPRAPDSFRGNLEEQVALLPTPVVNDMGRGKTVEEWDAWTDEMKAKHGNGNGHGPSLSIEAARLLPTPTVNDSHNHNPPPSQFNRNSLALPALMALLPTPTSVESKVFGPNVDWEKRLSNHAIHIASVLMVKPWLDGDESSDGPHLTQLTTEDCDPDSSSG